MSVRNYNYTTARFRAATRWPYIAPALFSLTPVEQPGLDTLGVDDHWRLYIDPALYGRWSLDEFTHVLLHEVGHLLRRHAVRARARGITPATQLLWNVAGDLEINDDLKAEGIRLPEGCLYPDTFQLPAGNLMEWYYDHLPTQDQPPGCDCGSGADGVPREYELPGPGDEGYDADDPASVPGLTASEQDMVRQDVAVRVEQAQRAKGQGSVGAYFQRLAECLAPAKVNWRRELAALVRRTCAVVKGHQDYSWRRLNRRAPAGFVLPSLVQPQVRISVVIDTSGSMDERDLAAALAELSGVLKSLPNPEGVRVLAADTEVQAARQVFRLNQVQLMGGGGTCMTHAIQQAAAERPRPDVVIVLTDGLTDWPTAPVGPELVAVITGDYKAREMPKFIRHLRVGD